MKNCPKLSLNGSNYLTRVSFLALFMASCMPAEERAGELLPDCKDIGLQHAPKKSQFLNDGDEADIVCLVDGDTMDVILKKSRKRVRIRLRGVDCPESYRCKKGIDCDLEIGKDVKEKVRKLLGDGKDVKLERKFSNNRNRKTAFIRLKNGKDLGLGLVKKRWCVEGYTRDNNRRDKYIKHRWSKKGPARRK